MCGAKLAESAAPVLIDDNDPLDIETSYCLNDRASAREPIQFRELERRREFVRDTSRSCNGDRRTASSATIANLPPDTLEEEAVAEARNSKPASRATGIGGPSFLGLGYEDSNRGFIYDKPKDDGFVYDSESETPEYLLTEVSRGVSWRAWAFFLLLIIGGGLGYVQWRASHNQGPDIAAILSGNGATVDPSGPDMRNKPASLKPPAAPNDSSTTGTKDGTDKDTTPGAASSKPSSESDSSAASKESAEVKNASASEEAGKPGKAARADEEAANENSHSKSSKTAKSADEDSDESAKPESDGPVEKATKSKRSQPAPVEEEEAPQPKSLGEKDPLIVQANKQLRVKNCSSAVNLLRQASSAGNPSADVKMGALYWSGTCVTQSNVTAYQWFARAHSLEPKNRWIERSRSSLWARLTPAERRRMGY